MTAFGPETRRHRQLYKSHLVGMALLLDGTRTTAYRAVVDMVCGACARPILPDHLFSRGARQSYRTGTYGMGLAKVPICETCRPLRMEGATDAPSPPEAEHHDG